MIIKIKKRILEQGAVLTSFALLIFLLFIGLTFTTNHVIGAANITNKTIIAVVNVTNSNPNITSISIDDDTPSPANEIDLIANGARTVVCNATVFDYNGFGDLTNANNTNASLFMQNTGSESADDNNTHYTNSSCGSCVQASDSADPSRTAWCDCQFAVQYYANDSNNWVCNFFAKDNGGHQRENLKINLSTNATSSAVTVTKLLALDTPSLLDYGNLSVTDTSPEIVHNVTNVGNIDLNLSLRGYGGINETAQNAINYTMICDFGNISIGNQKYALGSENEGSTVFASMTVLQNQSLNTSLSLPQRVDDDSYGNDRNSTLWRISVPFGVGGICNGTIVFGAVDIEG